MTEVLLGNEQFFLILMVFVWSLLFILYIDTKETLLGFSQFLVMLPLFLFIESISFLNSLVFGYVFGFVLLLLSSFILKISFSSN